MHNCQFIAYNKTVFHHKKFHNISDNEACILTGEVVMEFVTWMFLNVFLAKVHQYVLFPRCCYKISLIIRNFDDNFGSQITATFQRQGFLVRAYICTVGTSHPTLTSCP